MNGNAVQYIVVHCAATKPLLDIGAAEIDQWHKRRGWEGIGYHYVIRRDGHIEPGRPIDMDMAPGWQIKNGAHVAGHNSRSVGVCLVGGLDHTGRPSPEYTEDQWETLRVLVSFLVRCFPSAEVLGHHDLDPGKECPCFDVRKWLAENLL
ncbi:MAG: N-acetylmuramoyl-L-alanine amidase [Syntrophobacteraceae bacterium]